MTHAFSETSLREQEPLIHRYCDFLIKRLYDQIKGPKMGEIDIVSWLNFTTFDIIGDLTFGEPFHGLEKGEYHSWISIIFNNLRLIPIIRTMRAYPALSFMMYTLARLFPFVLKAKADHQAFCQDKTMRRLERRTSRRDFMT